MMKKRNLRLTVEYDGTPFYGWQIQKNQKTVQGEIQKAVEKIIGKRVVIFGAGRTDAGVHALGQVANFHTTSKLSCRKWVLALNSHLPEEISILEVEEVPLEFHSQFDAHEKTYRYSILNRPARSAVRNNFTHLVKPPLDVKLMAQGAHHLVGTHDYRSFGSDMSRKKKTVRTIRTFDVRKVDDEIHFTVTGDGFLYNQVRAMVGSLLLVGSGSQTPAWIRKVLVAKDRQKAGPNVHARGLMLVEVLYPVPGNS